MKIITLYVEKYGKWMQYEVEDDVFEYIEQLKEAVDEMAKEIGNDPSEMYIFLN